MDSQHLGRLQEEQQKGIFETQTRIEQCEKFKSDYKALDDRLKTLPDTVKHDIMVPFGRLGFMPGQLVHTNEVLVLLGDNWFVERSAKQASEIAHRRIAELNKQIKDLKQQKKLLTPRLNFTSDLQSELQGKENVKEIVEEYDEEKERQWDEQHKRNVKKHREEIRQQTLSTSAESGKTDPTVPVTLDPDLWERLDQLERLEDERGDMNSSAEDSDEEEETGLQPGNAEGGQAKPQVTWADEAKTTTDIVYTDSSEYDEDEEEDEEGGAATRPTKTIAFTHSTNSPPSTGQATSSDGAAITSPADIYKLFCPKPILKKPAQGGDVHASSGEGSHHHTDPEPRPTPTTAGYHQAPPTQVSNKGDMGATSAKQAFSGQIIERPGLLTKEENKKPETAEPTSTKRVSRFKAERMKNTS